ncbi:hypothetical protein FHX44_111825 [Pseudonocardia hierapolitana]|uniref:Uncharacterized protein n=1 Tax=Pseudonocardia hierapolitana TaxID=1128676 RepID=A0A561SM43_9PSEU|nr:hypothetical protein [Pseudonocardia hierapolitana]TWF75938.1 hypothetical protein FHX44_111825 [Pseudonocardia hierapolitana]
MDAGSFVIALLTAAGAAAGPAPLGALQDTTAPAARCIAAPDEERLGSARPDAGLSSQPGTGTGSSALPDELVEELADIITRASLDSATRQDSATREDSVTRQDSATVSSALAEELAQELADVVAESDDPTSRRLAAALAAAGFEASAAVGSRQETAASRSDDNGLDDRSGRADQGRLDDRTGQADQDRLGDDRLEDSRLDQDRADSDDGLDRGRRDDARNQPGSDDRLADDRLGQDEQLDCDGGAQQQDAAAEDRESTAGGANRSGDLEDVLSSQAGERERAGSERSGTPAGRGGSGIADALERGERTAE